MVKRRFNNLRTEIANNSRSISPKKSLYDLRERAKKIVETAKKTPEEQPINVGDNRCRDLKKNSSRKSVPIYKPDKILPS